MTEANLNPDESPNWFKEYSFKDAFALSDLSPKSVGQLVENWKTDTEQLKKVNHYLQSVVALHIHQLNYIFSTGISKSSIRTLC